MIEPARFMPWPEEYGEPEQENVSAEPLPARLLHREWLITNGLGGYASGTLAAVPTRRYHGLLVAALPAPLGRTLMLGPVVEVLHLPDGTIVSLGGEQSRHLREFRLDWGLPVWSYETGGFRLEKRAFLAHLQNTVHVIYRLTAGEGPVRLELHPRVHFRPHDAPVSTPLGTPYRLTACEDRFELCSSWPNLPALRLSIDGRNPAFTVAPRTLGGVYYEIEARRGYESVGDLWTPGFLGADLSLGEDAVALTASTEPWEVIRALRWEEALAAEHERRRRLVATRHDIPRPCA